MIDCFIGPSELKYTSSHEWVKLEDSSNGKVATIGITEDAISQLGDIVFVELPKVGAQFGRTDAFGTVESVKAASDIYAPVSGEVVEINSKLVDEPSIVSSDPFVNGWLIKMNVTGQIEELLTSEEYAKVCDH